MKNPRFLDVPVGKKTMPSILIRGLSKDEERALNLLRTEMQAESWRDFLLDLAQVRETAIDRIPARRRWEIASRALTHIVTLYSQALKEEAGLEKYYEVSERVWAELGRMLKPALMSLKPKRDDASSVHQAIRTLTQVILGAELKFEAAEALPSRSVVRIIGCPWYQRMMETGMQSFCEPHHEIHERFCDALVKTINQNLAFRFTVHTTAKGYPYCEEVVESLPAHSSRD